MDRNRGPIRLLLFSAKRTGGGPSSFNVELPRHFGGVRASRFVGIQMSTSFYEVTDNSKYWRFTENGVGFRIDLTNSIGSYTVADLMAPLTTLGVPAFHGGANTYVFTHNPAGNKVTVTRTAGGANWAPQMSIGQAREDGFMREVLGFLAAGEYDPRGNPVGYVDGPGNVWGAQTVYRGKNSIMTVYVMCEQLCSSGSFVSNDPNVSMAMIGAVGVNYDIETLTRTDPPSSNPYMVFEPPIFIHSLHFDIVADRGLGGVQLLDTQGREVVVAVDIWT